MVGAVGKPLKTIWTEADELEETVVDVGEIRPFV